MPIGGTPLLPVPALRQALGTPRLWPLWPYLPVVRRWPGGVEELGVVIDFRGTSGRTGFRNRLAGSLAAGRRMTAMSPRLDWVANRPFSEPVRRTYARTSGFSERMCSSFRAIASIQKRVAAELGGRIK